MSLMSGLYVGASGLQTNQNALNTTAHNLSNVDTVGYTRQQVQQSDKRYLTISRTGSAISYQQLGLGTTYSKVKQVRDYFLDKTYRKEVGREQFYKTSTEVLEEVESQLGELTGEAFQTNISDLWTSVQELVKDPSSSVTQGLFVQRATEFVERAGYIYEGLSSYQDNLNKQVKQQIDKINEYGKQILTLNDTIRSIESGDIESANDYRDTRNTMMDELSKMVDITWTEDSFGDVEIKIEGVDFVKGGNLYQIGLLEEKQTGFYIPFWEQNANYTYNDDGSKKFIIDGAKVFDLDRTISSDLNTDCGGLKAMLLARGDHRADYTDIQSDYSKVSQSVIMNIQAEFDQMVHSMTTKINEVLATAAGVTQGDLTLRDGTVLTGVRYAEADGTYMRTAEGSPVQVFERYTVNSYDKVAGLDGKEYFVYREEDPSQSDTLYTLRNLQIDRELAQKPAMMGFKKEDGSVDVETAEALKEAFSEEIYTLNPNVQKRSSFVEYYSDLVSQIGNSGYVFRSIYENQTHTVEYTESARDQVHAVSSDEELANMIKQQNAFNASSRYINTVSEMLEHMITSLFG